MVCVGVEITSMHLLRREYPVVKSGMKGGVNETSIWKKPPWCGKEKNNKKKISGYANYV